MRKAYLLVGLSLAWATALAGYPALAQVPRAHLVAPAPQAHATAVTTTTSRRQGSVLAGGVAWQCQGDTCTTSAPLHPPLVASCEALAREVGALKSFASSEGSFGTAEIGACNAAVTHAAAGIARVQPAIAPPSPRAGLFVPPKQPDSNQAGMPAAQLKMLPPLGGIGIARAPAVQAGIKAPPPPPLALDASQSLKLIFPPSGPLSIQAPPLRLVFPH